MPVGSPATLCRGPPRPLGGVEHVSLARPTSLRQHFVTRERDPYVEGEHQGVRRGLVSVTGVGMRFSAELRSFNRDFLPPGLNSFGS